MEPNYEDFMGPHDLDFLRKLSSSKIEELLDEVCSCAYNQGREDMQEEIEEDKE